MSASTDSSPRLSRSDSDLINALAHDEDAWRRFYVLYVPAVAQRLRHLLPRHKHHDIEDVCQEVAIRVFNYMRGNKYDRTKGFRKLLMACTRTAWLDFCRVRRNQQQSHTKEDFCWDQIEADVSAIETGQTELLKLAAELFARSEVTPCEWSCYELVRKHDYTLENAAKENGVSTETARRYRIRVEEIMEKYVLDNYDEL